MATKSKNKTNKKSVKNHRLVINRKTWLHGEGHCNSDMLRSSDGKMCCLGFYCVSLGIPKRTIKDKSSPGELDSRFYDKLNRLLRPTTGFENLICERLISINDSVEKSDKLREKQLVNTFKKINVDVKFVNKYDTKP